VHLDGLVHVRLHFVPGRASGDAAGKVRRIGGEVIGSSLDDDQEFVDSEAVVALNRLGVVLNNAVRAALRSGQPLLAAQIKDILDQLRERLRVSFVRLTQMLDYPRIGVTYGATAE
jgi:hypothetical protein